MEILLTLSVAIFAGLMLSRLAKKLKLPAVTAYLIAGVLIGPCVLGKLGVAGLGFIESDIENEKYKILRDIALGFIAFAIGNEFRLAQLKKIGKQATVIGIFQAVFTTLLVDAALVGVHFIIGDKLPLPAAIVLGAVAAATAPAATLMVVRQYKAKGPVTDVLLPVVALDDAVGLVVFSISYGIAKAFINGKINIISVLVEPVLEVAMSLLIGFIVGAIFTFFERFFHSRSKRLAMSVAFVLATVGISELSYKLPIAGGIHLAISPLLTCMMLGTIFCNMCDFSENLMDRLDRWTAPLFILFFVISGAEFELSILGNITVVIIGVIYILVRCLGKYLGARISSQMVKSDPNIIKYLGITLFPQAGVALGMANEAKKMGTVNGTDVGEIVANIALFAVLIYELVGPMLTKISLLKAGEIDPEGAVSARQKKEKQI